MVKTKNILFGLDYTTIFIIIVVIVILIVVYLLNKDNKLCVCCEPFVQNSSSSSSSSSDSDNDTDTDTDTDQAPAPAPTKPNQIYPTKTKSIHRLKRKMRNKNGLKKIK